MKERLADDRPDARGIPAADTAALQEFAQAFLTLEQTCSLYPEGHQARAAPTARLLELMLEEVRGRGECAVACTDESVLWRGALHVPPPPAALKLALLLGALGIARLVWSEGLASSQLGGFIGRLAAVRATGRRTAWEDEAHGGHLRVEGPDYHVLMAAPGARGASENQRRRWRELLARALGNGGAEPSEEDLALLRGPWQDPSELAALLMEVLGPDAGLGSARAVGMLRELVALVERAAGAGEGLEPNDGVRRLAELGRRLPPSLRLRLLEATADAPAGGAFTAAFGALAPVDGIALLADNFSLEPARIELLTKVFRRLVPRRLDRMELAPRLLERIRDVRPPDDPLADNVWARAQELLTEEAGTIGSSAYRELLGGLAALENDRRVREAGLAVLPALTESLGPAQTAGEALLIQIELVELSTSLERYHDVIDCLAGLCAAALTAGDRERGMLILRRLLEIHADGAPLPGPRLQIERSLKAVAVAPVMSALAALLPSFSPDERKVAEVFTALVPEHAIPALLNAFLAQEDPARREQIAALLGKAGPGVGPAVLQRLARASEAEASLMLPLLGAAGGPGTVSTLLSLLGRSDRKLRRDALQELVRIDSDEVRRELPRLLEDPDQKIAEMAADHLGAAGSPETVRGLLGVLSEGRLSGPGVDKARRAILVLGRMRAPEAVAPLARLLQRRSWIKRRMQEQMSEDAAKALARIGGAEARQALERTAARASGKIAVLCRRLLARQVGE